MSVLDEIVARKRSDVAERMRRTPQEELARRALPTRRSFAEALRKPGTRFILECKKASPSEGCIRPNFDIAEIARTYAPFADAVSVLTDEPYFQGGFAYLRAAREILDQPILCKDFVISPYQVYEARANGADAVLLMLSVLDDNMYRTCSHIAAALSMDVLTEAHDEEEVDRAVALGAEAIGLNNRDLKTLRVDLGVTARLADRIPGDRIVVCESGIRSHADVVALRASADAFLVGTRLMKEARLDLAVRETLFGRVKICGLTTAADAGTAYACGASLGGVIFAPDSPRCVDEKAAQAVAAASPLPLVGVFVDEDPARIARIAETLPLAAVQLHGDETDDDIGTLRPLLPQGCEIWKAVRVADALPAIETVRADRLLLDTHAAEARGGTGHSFDWELLRAYPDKQRIVLAGGISPENADRAMSLGVYAIDANSRLEYPEAPGRKNPDAVRTLFEALRGA